MEMVGQRDVYNNFNLRLLNSGKDIWTKLLRFVYVYVSGGGETVQTVTCLTRYRIYRLYCLVVYAYGGRQGRLDWILCTNGSQYVLHVLVVRTSGPPHIFIDVARQHMPGHTEVTSKTGLAGCPT